VFDVTTGQELRQLFASDVNDGDLFGANVAIEGNLAIVNAANDSYPTPISGSNYVFDVTTGELLRKLGVSDPGFEDVLSSVAISNGKLISGAFLKRGGGAAYIFDLSREPIAIPGDFNNDGTVDAADYIAWRNGLGTTYTQADYNIWRANFGRSAAGAAAVADTFSAASSANIPEPAALLLSAMALATLLGRVGDVNRCGAGARRQRAARDAD
jgi:hypothetical protein